MVSMESTLTWLDYSERDRGQVLEVIDLFRETTTVDELGLAGIRNSYADLLFPGTTTLQTRACYFLLVPWTLMRLERLQVASSNFERRARDEELRINSRLREGPDASGVFGALAGRSLKRLPSEIYWSGLLSWGIRLYSGHAGAYCRSLDDFYRHSAAFRNDSRDREARGAPPSNWHPHIPDPPTGFPEDGVTVALRREDAEYLRDRIQARHPESVLAVLAGRINAEDLDEAMPWDFEELPEISTDLKGQLRDAKNFAVCMEGAPLLYNLMLSEKREHGAWVEKYRSRMEEWAADVEALGPALRDWKLESLWQASSAQGRFIGHPTREFIRSWMEILMRGEPAAEAASGTSARSLVQGREVQLKGGRARLASKRHRELWGGESGTGRMSYRWNVAKRLLRDVFDGMARD